MKITEQKNGSTWNMDFSELISDKAMLIYAYGGGNAVVLTISEKEMRELRKHLTIQIRKIKKDGKK